MRKTGYYWIKPKFGNIDDPLNIHDKWEVAFYEGNAGWYSIWEGGYIQDEELLEINETPLSPTNLCRCDGFNGMHVESVTKCSKCNKEIKTLKI